MQQSSPEPHVGAAADLAECRRAIRSGSRTFYAASLVLPASVRNPAYGLYAFCRLSDDAVDLGDDAAGAVERLTLRLQRAYEGRPFPFAADRAMADLVRRYTIPSEIPHALIEGLAWDADGRRYETIDDLYDYAARVAGTVGVMMTLLMGVRDPEALARACDLGVAMQLTNIARDVGEDARNGRLYLPLSWLREAGLDPQAFLESPQPSPALRQVVRRLLTCADVLYARSRSGVAQLPQSCRPAILAAGYIYAEIGHALEALSLDNINHRARVPGSRKSQLLALALARAPLLKRQNPMAPLDAVRFLIDAVKATPFERTHSESPSSERFGARFVRVLDVFERLERADQAGERRWIPSIMG